MLFVARFGFWYVFPFAVCCLLSSSLLFLVFETINSMAGKCLLLLVMFFCGCFHLSIALLVVAFRLYEKPKRATKGKKCPNGNQALRC